MGMGTMGSANTESAKSLGNSGMGSKDTETDHKPHSKDRELREGREGRSGPPNRLPGDWDCPKCGDLVFARNSACRICGTPKPDPNAPIASDTWRPDSWRDSA